jgi:hypothetical protein
MSDQRATTAPRRQPPVEGRCAECGFDYDAVDLAGVVTRLVRQAAEAGMNLMQAAASGEPEVIRLRPEPEVWSAIEYACHIRDVLEVQRARIAQALVEYRPVFAPMDRTGRVKQEKYEQQDPVQVSAAIVRFAREFGAAAKALTPDQQQLRGLYNYPVRMPRTLDWVIRHTAHEIQHHRHDITEVLRRVSPEPVERPVPRVAPVPADPDAEPAEAGTPGDTGIPDRSPETPGTP